MINRSLKYLKHNMVKTVLYVILFTFLFLAIFAMLMIMDVTGKKVEKAQTTLANAVTLRGPTEEFVVDGSSVTGIQYVISAAVAEQFVDSPYVRGYSMDATACSFTPLDTQTYISDATKDVLGSYLEAAGLTQMEVSGVFDTDYHTLFVAKGFRIVEGEGLTYTDADSNLAVVGEKYAAANGLSVGDTVTYQMPESMLDVYGVGKADPISFQIKGIYSCPDYSEADSTYDDQRSNLLFIPMNTFWKYTMETLEIDYAGFNYVTVFLDSAEHVDAFIEETKEKINIEAVDDVVQTGDDGLQTSVGSVVASAEVLKSGEWPYQIVLNREWYDMVARPMEKVNNLTMYMAVGFIAAAILLFVLLVSLNLKGRHREIGILLSMGESRRRILGQLVLENLIPVILAFLIVLPRAVPVTRVISDTMIAGQAEKVEDENSSLTQDFSSAVLVRIDMLGYSSVGVETDTDVPVKLDLQLFSVLFFWVLNLFLVVLMIQVNQITSKSPASILLVRK